MNRFIFPLFLFIINASLSAQSGDSKPIEGNISFITSRNVYVKFISTEAIEKGDTLYIQNEDKFTPCLIVDNKSSSSCVCTRIGECDPQKGAAIFSLSQRISPKEEKENITRRENEDAETAEPTDNAIDDTDGLPRPEEEAGEVQKDERTGRFEEDINGRISIATYSNLSDRYSNFHRVMSRVSLNARNIGNTGWSFEGYANYRYNMKLPQEGGEREIEDRTRIFNLAVTYDVDSSMWITFGRKINRRASSLGAIDGLQTEKHFGNFFTGAIVGFRPDLFEYDLNTNLFEYGLYGGIEYVKRAFRGSTTLGLLEQQNSGNVDRRYLYAQHNSSIGRDLYFFGSAELDLYSMVEEKSSVDPRLTNLFVSLRYKFSRKLDLTVSYDSRKQVIFFETLRTEVERLLEDDEARQGIRVRLNFRPIRLVSTGVSYSKRFQTSQQNPSDNINGFISLSTVPGIGGRFAIHGNVNRSSYLLSKITSLRYSRTIIRRKMSGDLYFRLVNYDYVSSEVKLQQKYYGASLSYRLGKSWSLNVLYELSDQPTAQNQRVNTRIIKRFR